MSAYPFMPVSVSGGFWTGASVVVDLLAEHVDCAVVPGEFVLFSHGQLFQELRERIIAGEGLSPVPCSSLWRLREFNRSEVPKLCSAARYVCAKLGWYPRWLFSKRGGLYARLGADYRSAVERLTVLLECDLSAVSAERLQAAFVEVLAAATRRYAWNGTSPVVVGVFDQMVAPPYAEVAWQFLPDLRLICVDRDWRDQYVEIHNEVKRMNRVKMALGMTAWGMELTEADTEPKHFFVRLRKRIEQVKRQHRERDDRRILWVNFEDVVLDTEVTARRIFEFLGLDVSAWRAGTVLDVSRSSHNIGKWRQSPYWYEIDTLKSLIPSQAHRS